MGVIYPILILCLSVIVSACNPITGSPFYPLKSDFRQEYTKKLLERDVGEKFKGILKQTDTILLNGNIALNDVVKINIGGWKTNCQYYYEVDKDTNIIVDYKITDPNPDKNCRMLPGY